MAPSVIARLFVFALATWLLARQYLDPATAEWMRDDPEIQALVAELIAVVPDLAGWVFGVGYAGWYWAAKKWGRPT